MNPVLKADFGMETAAYTCYLCLMPKKPEDTQVLSTGLDVENEGALDICLPCIRHLANFIGLPDPAEAERLRVEVERLRERNESLTEKLRAADEAGKEIATRRKELDRLLAQVRSHAPREQKQPVKT